MFEAPPNNEADEQNGETAKGPGVLESLHPTAERIAPFLSTLALLAGSLSAKGAGATEESPYLSEAVYYEQTDENGYQPSVHFSEWQAKQQQDTGMIDEADQIAKRSLINAGLTEEDVAAEYSEAHPNTTSEGPQYTEAWIPTGAEVNTLVGEVRDRLGMQTAENWTRSYLGDRIFEHTQQHPTLSHRLQLIGNILVTAAGMEIDSAIGEKLRQVQQAEADRIALEDPAAAFRADERNANNMSLQRQLSIGDYQITFGADADLSSDPNPRLGLTIEGTF